MYALYILHIYFKVNSTNLHILKLLIFQRRLSLISSYYCTTFDMLIKYLMVVSKVNSRLLSRKLTSSAAATAHQTTNGSQPFQ
jgi:hypothetical protein